MGHMKQTIALRYWLQGRSMHMALDAMEFAAGYHQGVRKALWTVVLFKLRPA